jgi:hypothetical protein
MKLSTPFSVAPRLRISGAIPLLALYDSWRGQAATWSLPLKQGVM